VKIGSLCSGYGGLDMAVEAYFNAETVWVSEIDKYASQVIDQRIGKPNLGDLKVINWAEVEPIDILTAGYPCQPFSHAGLRKGTDDERHLWPYILKGISELRPNYVILENVRGHLSLGFKDVLANLTEIGYNATWQVVRASDVGAPHQRARLFIIAYPDSFNGGISPSSEPVTDSSNCRCTQGNTCRSEQTIPKFASDGCTADSHGCTRTQSRRACTCVHGAPSEIINRSNRQINRFSREMDRQAVPDTLDQGRLNARFVEYMMGLPEGWVTDCDLTRTQQLKILGNGVVPQQAYHAISLIMDTVNNL
jgi:DNA (cytosine-5)-methyltransferase 1